MRDLQRVRDELHDIVVHMNSNPQPTLEELQAYLQVLISCMERLIDIVHGIWQGNHQ